MSTSAPTLLYIGWGWARPNFKAVLGLRCFGFHSTSAWRFMGSYKWDCKSPNTGYKYSYLTYSPTYNYP